MKFHDFKEGGHPGGAEGAVHVKHERQSAVLDLGGAQSVEVGADEVIKPELALLDLRPRH